MRRRPPRERFLRRSLRAAASSPDGDGTPDYAGDADAYIARHFVNLKNGVEAIPTLDALGIPHEYLRIQSTMCEVGDMEKVLLELDANFLVSAALGYSCVVYDYGSRDKKRGVPRALWYGLEFVRYALNVEWFGAPDRPPILRGKRVDQDFRRKLGGVSKSCKKRIRYYRQFIPPEVAARGRCVSWACTSSRNTTTTPHFTRGSVARATRGGGFGGGGGGAGGGRPAANRNRGGRDTSAWRRRGFGRITEATRTRSGSTGSVREGAPAEVNNPRRPRGRGRWGEGSIGCKRGSVCVVDAISSPHV